jgi:hypothetical protein
MVAKISTMTKTTVILTDPLANTLKIFVAANSEGIRSQSSVVAKALEEFFNRRGVPIGSEKSITSGNWLIPQKNDTRLADRSYTPKREQAEKEGGIPDPYLLEVEKAAEKAIGRQLTESEKYFSAYIAAILKVMTGEDEAKSPHPPEEPIQYMKSGEIK